MSGKIRDKLRALFTKDGQPQDDNEEVDKEASAETEEVVNKPASQPEPENEPMHVHLEHDRDTEGADSVGPSFQFQPNPASFRSMGGGAATSFGSVGGGPVNSFGSNATDFDNLTSPGAQAEQSAEYLQRMGLNPYGVPMGAMQPPGWHGAYWPAPPMWGAPGFMPGSGMPHPYMGYPGGGDQGAVAAAAAAAAAAAVAACNGGPTAPVGASAVAPTDATMQGMSPEELQARALETTATQLLAQAQQARAAAASKGRPSIDASSPTSAGGDHAAVAAAAAAAAAAATAAATAGTGPKAKEEKKTAKDRANSSVYQVAAGTGAVEDHLRTTVMLRNLPNDYTRDMLLQLLNEEGFEARYDFVYLPIDFKRNVGLGYAFVNLVTHEDANRAFILFSGYNKWKVCSQKTLEVAWGAPLQGLTQHVERYRNSPLMHEDVSDAFKPMLFSEGKRIEFPAPTRRLRPPRAKCCPSQGSKGEGAEKGADLVD